MHKVVDFATISGTLAFSNMPGMLKRMSHCGSEIISMVNCFNSASKMSLTIAFISYAGGFRSSVTTDTGVMKDPNVIIDLLEEAI